MKRLISFDIDGVLEIAGEPGPITLEMVRRAQELGYIIGSCSDRPVSLQRAMWEQHGITVEFAVLKHMLGDVKVQFEADTYALVSTRDTGRYADKLGFAFLAVDTAIGEPWMVNSKGEQIAPYAVPVSYPE